MLREYQGPDAADALGRFLGEALSHQQQIAARSQTGNLLQIISKGSRYFFTNLDLVNNLVSTDVDVEKL